MINQINHLNNLITIRENIFEPIQFVLVCDLTSPFKIGNGLCPKIQAQSPQAVSSNTLWQSKIKWHSKIRVYLSQYDI